MGSKDSISSKIDMDTKVKIEAMNRSVSQNKVHKNFLTVKLFYNYDLFIHFLNAGTVMTKICFSFTLLK